jgi:hypothetical protein
MIPKKYHYLDVDGNHFPDADEGDELIYTIDFSCWLTQERDDFVSAAWEVSSGAVLIEQFVEGTRALVKVSTPTVGTFKLVCTLNSTEAGKTQINKVPMMLKVY